MAVRYEWEDDAAELTGQYPHELGGGMVVVGFVVANLETMEGATLLTDHGLSGVSLADVLKDAAFDLSREYADAVEGMRGG